MVLIEGGSSKVNKHKCKVTLIMTKPKQDALAEEHLNRQGYEVYRPKSTVHKKSRGKAVKQQESLFPRYLFIHLNDTDQSWAPIRSTKGVLQLVRFGNAPAKVSADLIQALREREQEHTAVQKAFKAGDALRVESGPLFGLEAIFEQYDADERIIVFMNLLGQTQKVVLDAEQVEKLS
jgi:transcriptional antiterminator RfaH